MSQAKRGKVALLGTSFILVLAIALIIGGWASTAPAAPGEKPSKRIQLTLSGGSIGGKSNLYVSALAGIGSKFLKIEPTVIMHTPTISPTPVRENISDIATANPPITMWAYTGTGSYAGQKPFTDLRTLMYIGSGEFQIVVPVNSPIKNFKDLVGKRVAIGKKGMLPDIYFLDICRSVGVNPKDIKIEYLGHSDAGAAMALGKLDANFVVGSPPHPTWAQIDLTSPIRFLQFSDEELESIGKECPYSYPETLEKCYHHQGTLKTKGFTTLLLTTNRLPEEIAYGLVKNFMEHPDLVGTYHISMKRQIESGALRRFTETSGDVPYHAGSYRYFKEKGWKIQADRIPPEAKK